MSQSPEERSGSTPPPSARRPMLLVGERSVPDQPPLISPPPPPQPTTTSQTPLSLDPRIQQEIANRAAWRAGVLGALNLAARVLAVRCTLMLSVVGAALLTWLAVAEHDP